MAAVVFVGYDGSARVRARERTEEGEEREGVRGGVGEMRGDAREGPGRRGSGGK